MGLVFIRVNDDPQGTVVQFRPDAAASFLRLERRLGRKADVNRTVVPYEVQAALYAQWLAGKYPYPVAHPDYSNHVYRSDWNGGNAWDSDERNYDLWDEYGWVPTVKGEPWHFEYKPARDQHRFDPEPTPEPEEEDTDMRAVELSGAPDSGIIIQAATPPYSIQRQTFDALVGAYRLKSQVLADWQYGTVVREQWIAAKTAAALMGNEVKTVGIDLDDETVETIAQKVRDGLNIDFQVSPKN